MSVYLLISSGDGPGECQIAVAKVLGQLRAEATACDVLVSVAETPGRYGPVSASILLDGDAAEALAVRWIGTIQWTAESMIRPKHKRKNWFVGVHRVAAPEGPTAFDEKDVTFTTQRAGGPGGQHQNTTDSAVRAAHGPSGIAVVVRSERSQHRNKAAAIQRLKDLLALRDQGTEVNARRGQNLLHHQLERGNPLRVFKGQVFRERR